MFPVKLPYQRVATRRYAARRRDSLGRLNFSRHRRMKATLVSQRSTPLRISRMKRAICRLKTGMRRAGIVRAWRSSAAVPGAANIVRCFAQLGALEAVVDNNAETIESLVALFGCRGPVGAGSYRTIRRIDALVIGHAAFRPTRIWRWRRSPAASMSSSRSPWTA